MLGSVYYTCGLPICVSSGQAHNLKILVTFWERHTVRVTAIRTRASGTLSAVKPVRLHESIQNNMQNTSSNSLNRATVFGRRMLPSDEVLGSRGFTNSSRVIGKIRLK